MSDTQFDDEILDSNAISPTDEEGNPVPVTIPIALAPGVTVVYTTRLGGVSHGDFGDCNLGGKGGDDPQAILANRVSLVKSVGCGLSLVSQVHSGRAVDVDASWHLNTPFGFDVSGTPVSYEKEWIPDLYLRLHPRCGADVLRLYAARPVDYDDADTLFDGGHRR